MADLFSLETGGNGVLSTSHGTGGNATLDTGDLRRKYNFGDRVSELAIAQDPFFRFVSKVAKKSTDDPQFKFTERRPSYHKRYAYVIGFNDGSDVVNDAELESAAGTDVDAAAVGDSFKLYMATDYMKAGNIQNVYGQSGNAVRVGATGTEPAFFVPGQVVKVNLTSTAQGGSSVTSYALFQITTVGAETTLSTTSYDMSTGAADASGASAKACRLITCKLVKVPASSGELCGYRSDAHIDVVHGQEISSVLEPARAYVVGSSHSQGSGYPETWKDNPFSVGFGNTQIWKTAMAMDNTTRATIQKYEPNEWARIWREKLIEHKWDIEQSLLYGSPSTSQDEWYTQGAIDYISSYGNVFSLTIGSKTQDDFLDDLSKFLDPRYNNANATLFFVNTAVFNWLHKLSGYFQNNLEISPNFRADMSLTGKKKVFGVDITTISTPFGDMNVSRNIHLDGSSIKILACNMRYCAYRPLVGNGLNRDTAIYVGVQTLENSGVDRRVDLIQTEAGMEWQMPEAHAYWS